MPGVNPPEPGARIHSTDPFATPEQERSPIRRFRGRLAASVTLWAAPGPAGLTVSSTVVADGEPGRVLGLVDEESDFYDAVTRARRFTITPLSDGDQQVADWTDTGYGPVPAAAGIWAGCRLDAERPLGWSMLLEGTIATVRPGADRPPLLHYRGRYHRLG
jgi:3-hydroxy-9,10-secoandrosta-1,3,5(10)-triene-9,17-dione monooxygenase reductase component